MSTKHVRRVVCKYERMQILFITPQQWNLSSQLYLDYLSTCMCVCVCMYNEHMHVCINVPSLIFGQTMRSYERAQTDK